MLILSMGAQSSYANTVTERLLVTMYRKERQVGDVNLRKTPFIMRIEIYKFGILLPTCLGGTIMSTWTQHIKMISATHCFVSHVNIQIMTEISQNLVSKSVKKSWKKWVQIL